MLRIIIWYLFVLPKFIVWPLLYLTRRYLLKSERGKVFLERFRCFYKRQFPDNKFINYLGDKLFPDQEGTELELGTCEATKELEDPKPAAEQQNCV